MTPKRYFTFACLTALIQGGVIASQGKPPQLPAGVAMGSLQSVSLALSTPAAQASQTVDSKSVAKKVAQTAKINTTPEPKSKPSIPKTVEHQVAKHKKQVEQKSADNNSASQTKPKSKITELNQQADTEALIADTEPKVDLASKQVEALAKQGVSQASIALSRPTFSVPPSRPSYPKLARKRGFEGTATIEVMFNQIGEQLSLTLINSSGFNLLDRAALSAVKSWQFAAPSPQTAYAYTVRVPVKFALN